MAVEALELWLGETQFAEQRLGGVAFGVGLARAWSVPVVGMCSLDAIAWEIAEVSVPGGSRGDCHAIVTQLVRMVTRMSGSNHRLSMIWIAALRLLGARSKKRRNVAGLNPPQRCNSYSFKRSNFWQSSRCYNARS